MALHDKTQQYNTVEYKCNTNTNTRTNANATTNANARTHTKTNTFATHCNSVQIQHNTIQHIQENQVEMQMQIAFATRQRQMQYNTQHINITQHNKIDHYSTVHHLNMSPGQMDLVSFTCCLGAVATVKRWAKAVRLLGPRAATSGWEMNFVMCSEQIFSQARHA